MTEIALGGCTPEPLMSYLKALGVFRLVAEQADPDARLSWTGGVAHLDSQLDRDGLAEFFLEGIGPRRSCALERRQRVLRRCRRAAGRHCAIHAPNDWPPYRDTIAAHP